MTYLDDHLPDLDLFWPNTRFSVLTDADYQRRPATARDPRHSR